MDIVRKNCHVSHNFMTCVRFTGTKHFFLKSNPDELSHLGQQLYSAIFGVDLLWRLKGRINTADAKSA